MRYFKIIPAILILFTVVTFNGCGEIAVTPQFTSPAITASAPSQGLPSTSISNQSLTPESSFSYNLVPRPLPTSSIIKSGSLVEDEVWNGIIHVIGNVIVPEGITLTIEPGTIIYFAHNRDEKSLTLENYSEWPKPALYIYGTLLAAGSPDQLIVFTSDSSEPQGGDWRGIFISTKSNAPEKKSILKYSVIEYAHKSILFTEGSNLSHIVENCIIRQADHLFKKSPGGAEREGGSAITCWDASLPLIRGNIFYNNTHSLEINQQSRAAIENNIVCFNQKMGNYYGGANGARVCGSDMEPPAIRNNLFYRNWWAVEFNWRSKAVVENNIIIGNDAGLVICQGDPNEPESHPSCNYNNISNNDIDFLYDRHGSWDKVSSERFGNNNISLDFPFTSEDFYNANFHFGLSGLKDSGNPDVIDADGSRSDIGPNWDWSWLDKHPHILESK